MVLFSDLSCLIYLRFIEHYYCRIRDVLYLGIIFDEHQTFLNLSSCREKFCALYLPYLFRDLAS